MGIMKRAVSVFKEAPKPTVPTKDAAWSEASAYTTKDFPKYNPDALLSRKGFGVYQKMMTDEQVKAVVRFKRDAITSRDFEFCCDHEELSEEERALRIAIFTYAMERMRGTPTDAFNGILSAMYNGYSVTEKLFQPIEFRGKTWTGIKHLKLRPCDTFYFHVDAYGNIERFVQKINLQEQTLDIKQFIHYVQNPDYDEHYGRSELRECYRAWFSKDMAIKFQNIHLERFAAGFVWVQPKEGKNLIAGSQEDTDLRNVLSNIQAKTAIILPGMLDLHIEHPATTDAYERKIAQEDKAIAKALLVPNLLGITEQGNVGSYSQSETQLEAFLWTLDADAKRLEDVLNEQLFRELGDYNFGDELYPYFKFRPISDKKQMEIIKVWTSLVTGKAVQATDTDEEHLRKMLEFPEKGEVLAQPASDTLPGGAGQDTIPGGAAPATPAKPAAPPPMDETVVGKQTISVSAFSRAMKRVDFAVIANKADNSTQDAVHEIAVLNSAAVARLVALAGELKLGTADGNPNDIQKIQYTASEMSALKAAVNKGLKDAWTIGESHAKREIAKAQFGRQFWNEDQPRDEDGRWAGGGGGGGGASSKSEIPVEELFKNAAQKFPSKYTEMPTPREMRTTLVNLVPTQAAIHRAAMDAYMNGVGNFQDDPIEVVYNGSKYLVTDGHHRAAAAIKQNKPSVKILIVGVTDAALLADPRINPAKKFAVNDLALQDMASAYLKQKSYTLAGDISAATQKTIRNILMEGVKVSKTADETKRAIYKALEADGMLTEEAVVEALGASTVKAANARIETAIRTTSFEAINEARYSFFSDPALDGFVEALEYSAILDDRTTEICSQLNGETFGIDSEVWSTFRPPNHFNCRSILVPVTVRDTWSQGEEPGVMPQKGFGFNKQCNH